MRVRTHSRTWSTSISSTPGAQHDHRRDALAPLLVGQADDRGGGDGVVLEQRVLDLGGPDVLAAADDGVVGAALAEQVALDVDPAAVAGVEPAVGVDLRLGADVGAAHLVAADQDLAGHLGVELGAAVVDDADLDAGDGLADRREALLEHRLVAVEREAVVVGPEERDGAARLGEPVGVHEVGLGHQVQRPLEHRRVHAGARRTRGCAASGTRASGSASITATMRSSMVGTTRRVRDALALHGGDPLLGGEAGERHDPPADPRGAQHRRDARDVERRHRHDRRLVLTRAERLERVHHVAEQLRRG